MHLNFGILMQKNVAIYMLKDNSHFLELAINHNVNYVLIDDKYEIEIKLV